MVCLEKKQRWDTVKKTISILLLLTLFLPAAACGQVDALQAQYERNRAQSHREDVLREQRNDQGEATDTKEVVKQPWQVAEESSSGSQVVSEQ